MATERLEDKTWSKRAKEFFLFLKEIRKTVVVFSLFSLFIISGIFDFSIFGRFEWIFQGSQKYFFIGFLISAVLLYLPTKKFVSMFYSPQTSVIVELNSNDEPRIALYELGDELLQNLTFDGDTWNADRGKNGMSIYFAREYDVEENHAVVSALDEMNEVELMEFKDKIEEYRHNKNKWVQVGKELYSKFPTIVEDIEARFWKQQTDDVMTAMDFDREEIIDRIDEKIDEKQEDEDENDSKEDLNPLNEPEDVINSANIDNGNNGGNNGQ